ncbi:MAG: SpoIIE family protein phosphatase [Bryobacteraceae bacterium]
MSSGHSQFAHGPELLHQQQEVARLQGLLEASRAVHSTIELGEVLQCTLEVATKELESEGAFFAETKALAHAARLTYGRVPDSWPQADRPHVWVDCTHVPLWDKHHHLLTTLVVFRPGRPLSLEEQDFLEGLALQASVAIENARHHEQLLAWERTQQDLASARVIQQSLLPQSLPQIPGYSVSCQSSPCHEIGGDYVDIIPLDSHCFVAIVADIAGKGLASALVSASFRAAFRAMVTAGVDLAELAGRINDLHYAEGPEARRKYATAIMARLDARRHELAVVNAGHNPGFLLSAAGTRLLEASGPPLGLFPGRRYQAETHSLAGSCGLLLYTDGLTEVFRGEEEFGSERLLAEFQQLHTRRCSDTLNKLWELLTEFSGSGQQSDDMTALALLRDSEVTA